MDILTLAGQIGVDANGNIPEDLVNQMIVCYDNIKKVLSHFDCTLDNVIDETWFVTSVDECMDNVEELFSAREDLWNKPESTNSGWNICPFNLS